MELGMIDLALLREDTQAVIACIHKKDPSFDGKRLAELDAHVRKFKLQVDQLRSEKNELARKASAGVTQELRDQSKLIGEQLKECEAGLKVAEEEFKHLYLRCANLIDSSIPEGGKESNLVVRTSGEKPHFNFAVKNHVELGEALGWFDFDKAAHMSGSNFVVYKNDAVRLMYALSMFMFNNNMSFGFKPVLPPYLVKEEVLAGAGNFPRFKDEVYSVTADNLYLTPTAEVNLAYLHRDTIFASQDLPARMTAWTSCFRREAGGYGSTERGLIRVHQFEKLELYSITTPENSMNELDYMIDCAETILKKLGLHYRVSLLAAQDCSFSSAKTYDIEVWMPGQNEYKEVSSASNCTDFQARRSAIRYRPHAQDKTQLVHTLNASSLALPRLMVALMETYQQADGTIALPEVLRSVTCGI